MNDTVIIDIKNCIKRSEPIMKKRKYLYWCMSIAFLWITGCATDTKGETILPTNTIAVESTENTTPNPTVVLKENKSVKIQEPVFKEKEKTTATPISKQITKVDGLCEELEKVETNVEIYNSLNRKVNNDIAVRVHENSVFCLDETTGVVYFVNQGKDNFLYRMKDGEVALAVAMPMQQLYTYQGSVYFMVDNYGRYELEGMKTGDIYCYTPSSGAVELVYALGTILGETVENARDYKLLVEESGIYFGYCILRGEGEKIQTYNYFLPFGASEPIEDEYSTVREGWKEYYFRASYRVPEDGTFVIELVHRRTGEMTKIFARGADYCMIGDILYYGDSTSVECINLETGEQTSYDFLEIMKRTEHLEDDSRKLQAFTMTEDAIWVSTWSKVYRMDLQTREIICGASEVLRGGMYCNYAFGELYTDGKEVYGFTKPMSSGIKKGVVRIVFTDSVDIMGNFIIELEYLTE